MSDVKRAVYLPKYTDPEKNAEFHEHVVTMANKLMEVLDEYLGECSEEQAPNAYDLGAALCVATYLVGEQFPDERKAQVVAGLEDTLALNKSLANPPPHTVN